MHPAESRSSCERGARGARDQHRPRPATTGDAQPDPRTGRQQPLWRRDRPTRSSPTPSAIDRLRGRQRRVPSPAQVQASRQCRRQVWHRSTRAASISTGRPTTPTATARGRWTSTYHGFANGTYVVELHFAELFRPPAAARRATSPSTAWSSATNFDAFRRRRPDPGRQGAAPTRPVSIRKTVTVTDGTIVVDVNAVAAASRAINAIVIYDAVDGDQPPALSIGDVTVAEGDDADDHLHPHRATCPRRSRSTCSADPRRHGRCRGCRHAAADPVAIAAGPGQRHDHPADHRRRRRRRRRELHGDHRRRLERLRRRDDRRRQRHRHHRGQRQRPAGPRRAPPSSSSTSRARGRSDRRGRLRRHARRRGRHAGRGDHRRSPAASWWCRPSEGDINDDHRTTAASTTSPGRWI